MNALLVSHPCETLGVQLRASMPPLAKGEVLSPEKIRAINGGIASLLSLALHQPSQNRTIPRLAPHSCHMNALPVSHPSETLGVQLRASMPPLSKVRCCRPKKSGDYRRDCLTTIPRPAPTLPKPHYPSRFS